MLQEDCEIGDLYVGGYDSPFSTIKLTKSLRKLSGKIVECNWNNGKWEFMRERFDKSYPNAVKTAVSVCESIKNPVTEEKLIEIINKNTYASTKQKMPPPPQHLKKKC
jgi:mRNA-capping enzyme